MKIVVFGASGRTGRLVVEQALEQGHAVTAFVRDAASFDVGADGGARSSSAPPKLRVVEGDALDATAVSDAIEGQEAVVSAIGPRVKEAADVCSASIERIVAGMKQHGAARLICVTSSSDFEGFLFKQIMKPIFLREVYEDKERQEMQIYKSGLDWTIVRPGILRDGPRTGRYRLAVSTMPKDGWQVSRADLAEFIVRELKRRDYIRQALAIAY